MKISVEEVMQLLNRKDEINAVPLDSIVWTLDGKELQIPKEVLEEWSFMGMCNTSFIEFGFHLKDGENDRQVD